MKKILVFLVSFSFSMLYAQRSDRFDINNISINTKDNEFGTILSNEGAIYYLQSNYTKKNKLNEKSSNLYKSILSKNGEFSKGKKFPTDAIHAVFTNDNKFVYFSKKEGGFFQIYIAKIGANGRWKERKKLAFNKSNLNFKQPALNKDNSILFFVSDMPDSYGGTDIYFVTIDEGHYSKPIHLGKNVNTSGTEIYPFIGKNDKLYFSSSKHNSKGGLDIFESFYENGHYSKPSNLGAPINSPKDDLAYVIIGNQNKGYFSSNRIDGFGGFDIYYFSDKKPSISSSKLSIDGIIRNKINKKPIFDVTVELWSPDEHLFTSFTDTKGAFSFNNVKPTIRYDIVSYKEGFYGFAEVQTIPEQGQKLFLYLDPESPEEYEEEFNLSNEMTIIDTQTNEVIKTEGIKLDETKELSFAERRDLAKLEKEEKKKKEIAAAKEAEILKAKKKEEARIAALAARKELVEKEIAARKAHAIKVAEELKIEETKKELAEKKRIEAQIIAQEKAKADQKRRSEEAKERAQQKRIEEARLAQIEKEKRIKAEQERIAQEQAEKKRIAQEKQAESIAKQKAAEQERKNRIAQAKATAEKLRNEKEAKELAEKERIEKEIIAQEIAETQQKNRSEEARKKELQIIAQEGQLAQSEEEKQIQEQKKTIQQQKEEKKQIALQRKAEYEAQKRAIEDERNKRISQAKATAEKLRREKEAKELAEREQIEKEIIAQKIAEAQQIKRSEEAREKELKIKDQENQLAQIEEEKQIQAIEDQRNEKANEENKNIQTSEIEIVEAAQIDQSEKKEEKVTNAQVDAQNIIDQQRKVIEEERNQRIAEAQATVKKLQNEKKIAEITEVKKIDQDIAVQNKIIDKERNIADRLIEQEQIKSSQITSIDNENQLLIESNKIANTKTDSQRIQEERLKRIAEAQETANQLRKKQEDALKQTQQKDQELAKAEAEIRYTQKIIEQKEKAKQNARTIYSKNIYERERQLALEKTTKIQKKINNLKKEKRKKKKTELRIKTQIAEVENLINNIEKGEYNEEEFASITQIQPVDPAKNEEKEESSFTVNHSESQVQNDPKRCSKNINGAILSSYDNEPIAGANIDIYFDGQNIESVKTNANGEFRFLNVECDTEYTLISFKKDYNNIAKAEISTSKLPDQIILLLEPDPEEEIVKEVINDETIISNTKPPVKEIVKEDIQEIAVAEQKGANTHEEPEKRKEHTKEVLVKNKKIASDKIAISDINPNLKTPEIIGKKIQLNPIYFDLDEWYLTLSARRELDKIIVLMHVNKTMIIESGSHTDTRGPFDYNLDLSEKRSQETVGYLIANGVDSDRISGRGYGESMPLNRCIDGVKCTDKEHLVNRRTEFIILKR
jgi:outer membrane protein OmpA-like peptidoglycan-associated protein